MDAREFVTLVADMMTAQADYWKNRTQSNLIRSKDLEARVRKALAEGISFPIEGVLESSDPDGQQISLFGE